jgi:hypothetical protein
MKDSHKLAIALPLMIGFVVYLNVWESKEVNRFEEFLSSPEGKARIVQCLFELEGINGPLFEVYLKSESLPLEEKNLDLLHSIEPTLQYGLREVNGFPLDNREELSQLIWSSPEFEIAAVYYESYKEAQSIEEKLAVVRLLIRDQPEVWREP